MCSEEPLLLNYHMEEDSVRRGAVYSNVANEQFHATSRRSTYQLQYSQIYFCRFHQLKSHVRAAAEDRWVRQHPGCKVTSIGELQKNQLSIISGVLFRNIKSKPSILGEYAKTGADLVPKAPKAVDRYDYKEDETESMLEDDAAHVKLDWSKCETSGLSLKNLVTGLVVGLLGKPDEHGKGLFVVYDFIGSNVAPQKPLAPGGGNKFACFLSGIQAGNPLLSATGLYHFVEYIKGNVCGTENVSSIVRLVVCGGNTVRLEQGGVDAPQTLEPQLPSKPQAKRNEKDEQALQDGALLLLDMIISTLCGSIPVDLLGGMDDMTNKLIPQRPIHKSMLPNSANSGRFQLVGNPYSFRLDSTDILASSGECVLDYLKYLDNSTEATAADVMDSMLQYRHIAPTAPDTIPTQPVSDEDPFVLRESPHIFVAGNQDSFSTKLVSDSEGNFKCRMVGLPAFAKSAMAVLVNLESLDYQVLDFGL